MKCKSCSFVQVAEHPGEEYLNKIYSDLYFHKEKYLKDSATRLEQERRLKLLISAKLAPNSKVLDIGCATGDFVAEAAPHFDVHGQDRSSFAVSQAMKRCPQIPQSNFKSGAIETLDYPAHSFDCITLWDVIEHLWDPHHLLEKVQLWLKPGGSFILSTPDVGALTHKVMGRYWAFMTPPEHLSFYNGRTLETLLNQYNLQVNLKKSLGKSVNLGFLLYKVQRTMPFLMPEKFLNICRSSFLGNMTTYVPTADILYMSAIKN